MAPLRMALITRFLLAGLVCCLRAADAASSNTRDFYLQMAGIGPTSGAHAGDPATRWLAGTAWASKYASLTANWNVNVSQIVATRRLGWSVTLAAHGSPRWSRRSQESGGSMENVTAGLLTLKAAGLSGADVLVEYITEDDSAGVGFPQDLLRVTRAAGFSNGATKLKPSQAHDAWSAYLAEANQPLVAWPGVQRHARVGFPHNAHSVMRTSKLVMAEVANDDCGTLASTLPFLRGAARQFNKTWGVDTSRWWGVINGCVQNLPASLHRRIFGLTYVAGATVISVEGCGWLDPKTGNPNQLAQELDRFGKLVASGHLNPSERGTTDAHVGIVVPADLGWSERPSWAPSAPTLWSYANIPAQARSASAAVDGLLSFAYPGSGILGFLAFPFGSYDDPLHPPASPFARSNIAPNYAPDPDDIFSAAPRLPFGRFHDRNALHAWFLNGGHDPAPHRPMADTRWGDVLDIFSGSEWSDALARDEHRVIIWANDSISSASRKSLQTFADAGGTVVVSIGSARPSDAPLTGVTPTGEVRAVRSWEWSDPSDRSDSDSNVGPAPRAGTDHFLTAVLESDMAAEVDVVARSQPEGVPVVVRRPVGAGHVYTCTIPWFGARALATPVQQLLDRIIVPTQPVSITKGAAALMWTSTLLPDKISRAVAVANNADAQWTGEIHVRLGENQRGELECGQIACEDVWTGRAVPCSGVDSEGGAAETGGGDGGGGGGDVGTSGTAQIPLSIGAHDLQIIRVTCAETYQYK